VSYSARAHVLSYLFSPVYCSVLQCIAVCCGVLRCAAVCCIALQCDAACCSVLPCAAACCSVLPCVAVLYQCDTDPAHAAKQAYII